MHYFWNSVMPELCRTPFSLDQDKVTIQRPFGQAQIGTGMWAKTWLFVMKTVRSGACTSNAAMEEMPQFKNADGGRKTDRRQGTHRSPDVHGTANRGGKLASENRSNEPWRSLSSFSLAVNEALPQPKLTSSHEGPGPRRTDEWDGSDSQERTKNELGLCGVRG